MGRILQQLSLPPRVSIRFYPQVNLDLIDDLLGAERFVLCDATRSGRPPGTVTVLLWEHVAAFSRQPYCCHGVGLSDLIKIAAELRVPGQPLNVHLVGIEAQTLDEFGTQLSEAVEAALSQAVRKVLELVGAPAELACQVERIARKLIGPSPLEAFGG
jgi:hydrogenase maturation protease